MWFISMCQISQHLSIGPMIDIEAKNGTTFSNPPPRNRCHQICHCLLFVFTCTPRICDPVENPQRSRGWDSNYCEENVLRNEDLLMITIFYFLFLVLLSLYNCIAFVLYNCITFVLYNCIALLQSITFIL